MLIKVTSDVYRLRRMGRKRKTRKRMRKNSREKSRRGGGENATTAAAYDTHAHRPTDW